MSYTSETVARLQADGFERVDNLPEGTSLGSVWATRMKSIRLGGFAYKFAAVKEAGEFSRAEVANMASSLREVMTDESLNVFGFGENMIGYPVFATNNISDGLYEYITDEHDVQRGTSLVYPIAVGTTSGAVVSPPHPRLKQRNAYSEMGNDRDSYFQP